MHSDHCRLLQLREGMLSRTMHHASLIRRQAQEYPPADKQQRVTRRGVELLGEVEPSAHSS